MGERRQLTVLRQSQPDAATELFDDLGLSGAANTGHRQARVDGGADAGVEQIGLQIDLTVGDRNYVGGHEGGHVARLGFDHGQRGQ